MKEDELRDEEVTERHRLPVIRALTIIAVDNHQLRLARAHERLAAAYPGDTVLAFADPLFAVQYCSRHGADIAFVYEELRPITSGTFSALVHKFNENAEVRVMREGDEV